MAILINAHQIAKSFGAQPLFRGISFSVASGERVGLIGPNGAGKSTLLRLMAGQTSADEGTLSPQRGLKVGFLEQVPHFKNGSTVHSTILDGAGDPHDWEVMALAQKVTSELNLTGLGDDTLITQLSGGWKKRVALARELVRQPDLLLLDEPTNHLDVESILWLEEFLANSRFATVTITHDRAFLQQVSNRILELDRRNPDGLLSVQGDYVTYLEVKQEMMANQQSQEVRLRNTLRRETEWLRRGAKARTTKQQARIKRAGVLGQSVADLASRNYTQKARIEFQAAEKSPKKLVEAKGISKAYDGRTIVPKLDLLLTPTTRLGLLGANGSGKSTLIRLLLGHESPDSGTVKHSEHLQAVYFEQNRDSLDPETSVLRTVCPSGDHVIFRGNSVHVKSYLDRFMFSQGQMEMAAGKLSGGEQARLLIAKLMLRECNVLVLDEPTNDLDIATLEVLQDVLSEFPGAVILVSHDRYFLDQVSNKILAFVQDARGQKELLPFASVEQWQDWVEETRLEAEVLRSKAAAQSKAAASAAAGTVKKRKLGFNEQRELDSMESNIHQAEARLAELEKESADPSLASNAKKLGELTSEITKIQAEIHRLYARWSELE